MSKKTTALDEVLKDIEHLKRCEKYLDELMQHFSPYSSPDEISSNSEKLQKLFKEIYAKVYGFDDSL